MKVEIGKYIAVDDEVCHGKPIFKGTRILVSDVIELLAAGISIKEIIEDYYPSLNEEMIKDALVNGRTQKHTHHHPNQIHQPTTLQPIQKSLYPQQINH